MSDSDHASDASADMSTRSHLYSDNKQALSQALVRYEDPGLIDLKGYEEPVTKSHSEGKRNLDAEIDILSEIQADAESDDRQRTLPGEPVYGKNPQRRTSDEEWINCMKGDPHVRLKSSASIFRVPEFLKGTKREAYVPQTVSLGPYHNKSEKLAAMYDHKVRALRIMMIRSNIEKNIDRDDMAFGNKATHAISSVDDKIRAIYEESIDCDGKTLARMLCLDGCCILEVLRTLGGYPSDSDDPIFGENKLGASQILKDILMLENQVPWIVLVELLRLEFPDDGQVETMLLSLLVQGTWRLFRTSGQDKSALMERLKHVEEFDHVLGFLHKVIVDQPSIDFSAADQDEDRISIERCIDHWLLMLQLKNKALNHESESIPSAVELKNAGIKFRPCDRGISGIWFDRKRAIIYLPVLSITYGTEVLFRNLIAFEMCRQSEPNYVSSYVNLMDDLIDSQKDVALLRSMGILTKLLGSDKEVADLFNGLCKDVGTLTMGNLFEEVKKCVNEHYRYKFRVQFAELVRDYFSSSWKALATAAAMLILSLAIIQTIFTVVSVYKK